MNRTEDLYGMVQDLQAALGYIESGEIPIATRLITVTADGLEHIADEIYVTTEDKP